jgi:tRNA dimethylallyltransferase
MKPIIAIVGPTASGKSELALYLAKKFNGEIICADSRTIYRKMNIGTAKPYLEISNLKSQISNLGPIYQIKEVPHYMLDIVKPNETFTVAQFQEMAYQIIEDILKRGKIPFLVGGTGLYIDAVTKGLSIPRVPPNPELRARLEKMSNKILWNKLKKLDEKSALKIDPKNKRRIIRALEVCLLTGCPFSEQQKIKKSPYKVLTLGIKMPREKLYTRINERVNKMIEIGLVEEVRELLKKGYSLDLPSMSGLGYKQIGSWLVYGRPKSLNEAVYQIKRDTRRFARRQISWFKRDKSIKWIKNKKETEILIKNFLEKKI